MPHSWYFLPCWPISILAASDWEFDGVTEVFEQMQPFRRLSYLQVYWPVFETERTLTFTKLTGGFACFVIWDVYKSPLSVLLELNRVIAIYCVPHMTLKWALFLLSSNAQLTSQMSFHHPSISISILYLAPFMIPNFALCPWSLSLPGIILHIHMWFSVCCEQWPWSSCSSICS